MKELRTSVHEEKQPLETVAAVLQECVDLAYDLNIRTSMVFERVAGGYPVEGSLSKDTEPHNLLEYLMLLRTRLVDAKTNTDEALSALG